MHSSTELNSRSFEVRVGDAPASIDDLLPGFDERDRLGVVVRQPLGAVGASTLLLAAVTAFYDIQRAKSKEFFIYPDNFTFHVGRRHGDHSMLEVWPGHKEVVVTDDAEELLRAINDRAVTRLLVPDGEPTKVRFDRETLASAENRIVSAFVYSPAGRVAGADVTIAGNEVSESYVKAVLDPDDLVRMIGDAADTYAQAVASRGDEVPKDVRARLGAQRAGLLEDGRPVETFRRLGLDDALALLSDRGG
jgi:hypothetical protein